MKPGLMPGLQKEVTFTVAPDMCPAFDGEVVHQVCSTWMIVQYMELAGRMVLVDFLEPNEEGVGSHASCDHMGPAQVGAAVRVVATAADVNERELVCDCAAFRGEKMIAMGKTVQKIFPKDVLERILRIG